MHPNPKTDVLIRGEEDTQHKQKAEGHLTKEANTEWYPISQGRERPVSNQKTWKRDTEQFLPKEPALQHLDFGLLPFTTTKE